MKFGVLRAYGFEMKLWYDFSVRFVWEKTKYNELGIQFLVEFQDLEGLNLIGLIKQHV